MWKLSVKEVSTAAATAGEAGAEVAVGAGVAAIAVVDAAASTRLLSNSLEHPPRCSHYLHTPRDETKMKEKRGAKIAVSYVCDVLYKAFGLHTRENWVKSKEVRTSGSNDP